MRWQCGERTLDLARHGVVMGILNVTPDSFSDGGKFDRREAAVAHALKMVEAGAGIIDVGGESTRPGAGAVDETEELERVIPVIEAICREKAEVVISIDTAKAAVAEAACEAGAAIVNDVTGLNGDPRMAAVVAKTGAGVVIMHMQGTPRTMQRDPHYGDVVVEVREFFERQLEIALAAGIREEAIAFDPGIGFGKTVDHNLALIRDLDALTVSGRPLLLGVSRKSFIGKLLGTDAMEPRTSATVAITSMAREQGVRIHRVHDVAENVAALRTTEALLEK